MTSINNFVLKNFIMDKIGHSLSAHEAIDLDIEAPYQEACAELGTDYVGMDELFDNDKLYEQFATLYITETEKEKVIDEEKEKEEQSKVHDKNGAGV